MLHHKAFILIFWDWLIESLFYHLFCQWTYSTKLENTMIQCYKKEVCKAVYGARKYIHPQTKPI